MEKIEVKIKQADILKTNFKDNKIKIRVIYESNGVENGIIKELTLTSPENIVEKIFDALKKQESYEPKGDHILDQILIFRITDRDKTEEKLSNFFGKYKGKLRRMKTYTQAKDYINAYHKTTKDSIKL